MIPLLFALQSPARAEDPPLPDVTVAEDLSRRERRRAAPPDPRHHIAALVPGQLSWPAANLRYSQALFPALSLEGGLQVGQYNPKVVSLIQEGLKEEGIDAPLRLWSPEVGATLHPNNRFDRGLRVGLSAKVLRIATDITLYEDEAEGAKVSSGATLKLLGVSPMLYVGFRGHTDRGLVFDYRVGGGVMKTTAKATVSAEASYDDQQLLALTTDFSKAFEIPWVINQMSVGWLF